MAKGVNMATKWSQTEDDFIFDQREAGSAWDWIAERLIGRTKAQVYNRYNTIRMRRPDMEQSKDRKPRKCLSCGKSFDSDHRGNRVCPPCKNTVGWQAGINDLGIIA